MLRHMIMILIAIIGGVFHAVLVSAEEAPDATRIDGVIAAGLLFLLRHQDPEGCWRPVTAPAASPLPGPRIRPSTEQNHWQTEVVVTAIILRCLLRAGAADSQSPFHRAAVRAADWLEAKGPQVLENKHLFMMSTWLETIALINNREHGPLVDSMLQRMQERVLRHPDTGQMLGWFYEFTNARTVDFPATAWALRALEAWPDHAGSVALRNEIAQSQAFMWIAGDDLPRLPHRIRITDDGLYHGPQQAGGYGISIMRSLGVTVADEPRLVQLRDGILAGDARFDFRLVPPHDGRFHAMAIHSAVHGLGAHHDAVQRSAWADAMRTILVSTQEISAGSPHGSWTAVDKYRFRGSRIGDIFITALVLESLQWMEQWRTP